MKTQSFLIRNLPLLANVKNAGVFNAVIAGMAVSLIADLRAAIAEDRIVATELLEAFGALRDAQEFEPQQAAIADSHKAMDDLLDAIGDGTCEKADVVLSTAGELLSGILVGAYSIRDVYAVQADKVRAIRTAAAELSSIVDAEVAAGTRQFDDASLAARLYDGADGLDDEDFKERSAALDTVIAYAGRLKEAA